MINTTIVDDEPYCCEVLDALLERYCPQVRTIDTCYNGESALKTIMQDHPQLVFLDIEMPQMNGFELLSQLGEIDFKSYLQPVMIIMQLKPSGSTL